MIWKNVCNCFKASLLRKILADSKNIGHRSCLTYSLWNLILVFGAGRQRSFFESKNYVARFVSHWPWLRLLPGFSGVSLKWPVVWRGHTSESGLLRVFLRIKTSPFQLGTSHQDSLIAGYCRQYHMIRLEMKLCHWNVVDVLFESRRGCFYLIGAHASVGDWGKRVILLTSNNQSRFLDSTDLAMVQNQ